jgi:hypothetical protein
VNIIGIAAISFLAALVTPFIVGEYHLPISTPGMLVRDLPGGPSLPLGEKALVLIGVDSMAYFLLILGLIALFKWRIGKTQ